jgi:hypothetical protein
MINNWKISDEDMPSGAGTIGSHGVASLALRTNVPVEGVAVKDRSVQVAFAAAQTVPLVAGEAVPV